MYVLIIEQIFDFVNMPLPDVPKTELFLTKITTWFILKKKFVFR